VAGRGEDAVLVQPDGGAAFEVQARARYRELDFAAAIAAWERAYAAYRIQGDAVGAVRMARTLAGMHGQITGDAAVMSGWLARARTLLATAGESAERGWVALNTGMFEPDRARKHTLFGEALDVARRHGDADLEFTALAYLGASLVHDDRVDDGMAMLDEALAAVLGDEVSDVCAVEEIFCQLFAACEHAHDVRRADEWIRVGTAVAERCRLPAVSAFCHTHYGAVLTAAGRWGEADAALTEAVRLWALGHRSALRRGAIVRLADLRVRQGRIDEAAQLLTDLTPDVETAYPLAAIHLARGQTALAADVLDRGLAQLEPGNAATVPLLALLVEVHLAAGHAEDAAAGAERLAATAACHRSAYLRATAALAQGSVALADARARDARTFLHQAVTGFAGAELPMELARTRLALAAALACDRPEVALVEARAALAGFERLRAARHVDAAAALLRSLGVRASTSMRVDGRLTAREAEVLDLLGHGLSNPAIADRLFISRKTVEHHVANVLAKLGLRSRAEAAAYSARTAKQVNSPIPRPAQSGNLSATVTERAARCTTRSWSAHAAPAPRRAATAPAPADATTAGPAAGTGPTRNTTRRSPAAGYPAGSIAHDAHAITAQETAVQPPNHGPGLRITRGYRNYRADGILGRSHAAIERVTDYLRPLGDPLDQTHANQPSESAGQVQPDGAICGRRVPLWKVDLTSWLPDTMSTRDSWTRPPITRAYGHGNSAAAKRAVMAEPWRRTGPACRSGCRSRRGGTLRGCW
jgi:DNA-binding NarL/FixJ family response regulator/tetratricopeptide (TPR) repeat protein